jgi:tetratricopeptide (TPR) repeat protein
MKFKYTKYFFALAFIVATMFFMYNKFFPNDDENHQDHLHQQAHIALHNKEYERAIAACDKAIQLDQSSMRAYQIYVKKSQALNKLHRYQEALDSANLAIEIDPKKEEAYLAKVDPLFVLGREEELIAVLEEILVINHHTPLEAFLNFLKRERDKYQY